MLEKIHENFNAFLFRIFAAAGSAVLAFSIASTIDVTLVSSFYFTLTVVLGVSILIRYGLERSIVKFVGTLSDRKECLTLKQFQFLVRNAKLLIKRWLWIVLITVPFADTISNKLNISFSILVFTSLIISLSTLVSGFYRGVYRPTTAILFDLGITSLFSSGILYAISFIGVQLTIDYIFLVLSVVNTLILLVFLLINSSRLRAKTYKDTELESISPSEIFDAQRRITHTFMIMTLVIFFQNIIIAVVLEWSVDSSDLALFKIAEKVALSIGFFQSVIIAIYAPYFAKAAREKSVTNMVRTFTNSLFVGCLFAIPIFFLIMIFASELLGVFGGEYKKASEILIVLAIAQVLNVLFGQSILALNMSGKEKVSRNIIILSSVTSLPITYLLCKIYGGLGASYSILIYTVAVNLLSIYSFYTHNVRSKNSISNEI